MHLDRRPCFVFGVADGLDRAFGALWFASYAQAASVMDDLMAEERPALLRNDLHQVLFDFLGIVVLRELPASRDAMDVGIDYDAVVYF